MTSHEEEVEKDASALLLQTYDALDAFLREMDELDALGEPVTATATAVSQCSGAALRPPLLKQEQQQQMKLASSEGRVFVVKMESAAVCGHGTPAPPTVFGSVKMATTAANVPSASAAASRKRKHESHTSVVLTVENAGGSSDTSTEVRPVRRRRQKEELLQLRQQALDLETQLQTIKASIEPRESEQQAALIAARKKKQKTVEMQMWESHAAQEKKAKQSTEVVNARLKEITSKELKVSFEIEKLLLKCYTSALSFLPYNRNHDLAVDAHDNFLYEMLEKRVDARFHEMEKNRFEFTVPSLLKVSQKHESRIMLAGNQETGVEFKHSQIMPFDTTTVDAVSWKTIIQEENDLFTCKSVRTNGNTIAIHAKFTIHRENEQDIELEGHHVFKRFFSKKRVSLTWEGLTQWKYANTNGTSNNSDLLCLPTRESGYGILEPLMLPGSVPVTQIQMCTSTLPTKTNGQIAATGAKDLVRDANLLRDLIIPAMDQLFVTHQQIVENALLDESLSKKSLKL